MDSDPSFSSSSSDENTSSSDDEPFSPSGPATAIAGLLIALISLSAPLAAVITDRSVNAPRLIPTAKDRHGPQPTAPVALSRAGESFGGNSGWQPE